MHRLVRGISGQMVDAGDHPWFFHFRPLLKLSSNCDGVTHAFGLGWAWSPEREGWVPSVSLGWGTNSSDVERSGEVSASQSWTLALEWGDVSLDGNIAGMAVGQPVFATDLKGSDEPADGQFLWEWWYQFQVSDAISITPALYYLSRPFGGNTKTGESFQQVGALVKTSFSF